MARDDEGEEPECSDDDACLAATGFIAAGHVSDILRKIEQGKEMKKSYTDEQLEIINACAQIPNLDRLNLIQAFSKMSEQGLDHLEERLLIVKHLAEQNYEGLWDFQDVRIITMFMMILSGLRHRSKRHLENFLAAITDGDWMDGFINVGPQGIEFRYVDKASEDTRKEFGL